MFENGTINRRGQVWESGEFVNVSLVDAIMYQVQLFAQPTLNRRPPVKDSLRKNFFDCKTAMNDIYKSKEKTVLNNVNDGRRN